MSAGFEAWRPGQCGEGYLVNGDDGEVLVLVVKDEGANPLRLIMWIAESHAKGDAKALTAYLEVDPDGTFTMAENNRDGIPGDVLARRIEALDPRLTWRPS